MWPWRRFCPACSAGPGGRFRCGRFVFVLTEIFGHERPSLLLSARFLETERPECIVECVHLQRDLILRFFRSSRDTGDIRSRDAMSWGPYATNCVRGLGDMVDARNEGFGPVDSGRSIDVGMGRSVCGSPQGSGGIEGMAVPDMERDGLSCMNGK